MQLFLVEMWSGSRAMEVYFQLYKTNSLWQSVQIDEWRLHAFQEKCVAVCIPGPTKGVASNKPWLLQIKSAVLFYFILFFVIYFYLILSHSECDPKLSRKLSHLLTGIHQFTVRY